MTTHHRTILGLATSGGLLGLTVTSGLAVLASRFVEEFSHPHVVLNSAVFEWKVPNPLNEPEAGYQRSLLFAASDGTVLSGEFWAQAQTEPAPTIILCHGYRVSRTHLRSVATLNYACGYNVMLFDFRGHGYSDSVTTSGGNVEVRDLEAAIEVARLQPETRAGQIILHGFSMGAAVALMTPLHPEVIAIVADSPYARSEDILRRLLAYRLEREGMLLLPALRLHPSIYSALAHGTLILSMALFRIRFGYGFVAHPPENFKRWRERENRLKRRLVVESMTRLLARWARKEEQHGIPPLEQQSVPILLIHTRQDPLIPFSHAQTIAAAAKVNQIPLTTYFEDCSVHCGAYGNNPERYYRTLHDFLAQALGPALPEKHVEIQRENLPVLLHPYDIAKNL
jgi:uncharacterized protein